MEQRKHDELDADEHKSLVTGRILLVTVLVLVTIMVGRGIGKGEFDYNADEQDHAATGLYIAALVNDRPWSHPVAYTYTYYAQYPSLALIHWPPLFYIPEGLLFLLLGPSVVVARITIILFMLLGLLFWFKLVAAVQDQWTAALSTLVLGLLPSVLLFEKTVMLEIPTLSLCIAASYLWIQYLRTEAPRYLYWFALAASAAMLTKQNSIYLGLFCFLSLAALNRWKLVLNKRALPALAIVILLVSPFYTLVYLVHWNTVVPDLFATRVPKYSIGLFYPKLLPAQLGWPLLILSLLGLITYRLWAKRDTVILMVAWVLACYITFTLIGLKEARYILYWIPPFVYFATGWLTTLFHRKQGRPIAVVVALLMVIFSIRTAYGYERPYMSGYRAATQQLTQLSSSGIILFDGDIPGNFIFFIRSYDPDRRFMVLRKSLWAMRISGLEGPGSELVHDVEQLKQVIRDEGIKFIVVSDNARLNFPIQATLRELLHSPQFKLVGEFSIESNEMKWRGQHLLVYQNSQYTPPTGPWLRITMLTLNHDIVVPWGELSRVW